MPTDKDAPVLSPTVAQVIDRFVAELRTDGGLDVEMIEQLEKLLRRGAVPKPDEIAAALFGLPWNGNQ